MPSIVWKGQLTFGLVSVPVKLYRAARKERVRMHCVHRPKVSEEPEDEQDTSPPELPLKSAERAPQRLAAFPKRRTRGACQRPSLPCQSVASIRPS